MNNYKSERRKQHSSAAALNPASVFGATIDHTPSTPQEQNMGPLRASHSLADFTIHHSGESAAATPIQKVDATHSQGQPDRPQQAPSEERQENRTGLPDALKAGVESLSGYSLDDIRVHYNSPKPAEVQALAYTQGAEIHVGPGQEQHLAHEAWHVVQQMQGRVQATMQMKGVAINDDVGLEREADVMGSKADVQSASLLQDVSGWVTSSPSAIVQLMKSQDIEINKKYKYRDTEGKETEGVLLSKSSGWYTFDNGKARGADNVIEEVGGGGGVTTTSMEIEGEDHGDKSEESDSESDGEEAMEKEATTIREMFLDYLKSKKITKQNIINLLVDLNAENIKLAEEVRKLNSYKRNWQAYTSCFDAAERLFDLLGDPDNFATNTWNATDTVPEGINRLIADIETMDKKKAGCIYRIGVGRASSLDHSFVIVIQNGNAELLQSFAGKDGEALGMNLMNNQSSYTMKDIIGHLNKLISSSDKVRGESQVTLFGGRIDVDHGPNGKDITRNITGKEFGIKIDRRGLYDQDTLKQRIKGKIDANMKELGL